MLLAIVEATRAEKEGSMPIYVTLFKWTDSGVKTAKPLSISEARCSASGPRWAITIFYP
jgi:uncharacterized protein with GYD domain